MVSFFSSDKPSSICIYHSQRIDTETRAWDDLEKGIGISVPSIVFQKGKRGKNSNFRLSKGFLRRKAFVEAMERATQKKKAKKREVYSNSPLISN